MSEEGKESFQELLNKAPQAPDTISLTGTIQRFPKDPEKFMVSTLDGRSLTLEAAAVKDYTKFPSSTEFLVSLTLDRDRVPADVATEQGLGGFHGSYAAAPGPSAAPAPGDFLSSAAAPGPSAAPAPDDFLSSAAAPAMSAASAPDDFLSSYAAAAPSAALGPGDTGEIPSAVAAALIPHGLVCPYGICWAWTFVEGTGIYTKVAYTVRLAIAANGAAQFVYVLQNTNGACVLTNVWDWFGNGVVNGSRLVITSHGSRTQTNTCNPAQNYRWPIGGVLNFLWSLDPTNTRLTLITPWPLGRGWTRFLLTKVRYS